MTKNSIQIDLGQDGVDIHRIEQQIDHALSDPLSGQLHRIGKSTAYRPQPVTWIHVT